MATKKHKMAVSVDGRSQRVYRRDAGNGQRTCPLGLFVAKIRP
jgi:hypothetical protein